MHPEPVTKLLPPFFITVFDNVGGIRHQVIQRPTSTSIGQFLVVVCGRIRAVRDWRLI